MAQIQYPLDNSKYFDVREFIHPMAFNAVGPERARWFISDFQRDYAELLKRVLGMAPIQINNWHLGGDRVGRGTRPRGYKPKGGAEFSQHYLSNALDVSSPGFTPKQIMQKILENEADFKAIGLTTMEDIALTPTWLHGDCRPFIHGIHPETGFLIVKPS
jgi:hypothetical protein